MFKMKYKVEQAGRSWFVIVKRRFFWQAWSYTDTMFTNKDHAERYISEVYTKE